MSSIPPHALVTGGARRIGKALALELARQGFAVSVHCRRVDTDAEVTLAAIEALGRPACLLPADLAREPEVEALVPAAVRRFGPVGMLVNNAAVFELDRLDTMTQASWERHMAVNLRAPAILCQAYARDLPADAEGLIVNIVDERVLNLTPNYLSYSVAKAGLWAMTQVLARQLAPRIRVNAIGPGPALPASGAGPEEFAALCRKMPLERGTSPEELAAGLAFILRAPSMTGHLLTLDGGQHMGWLTPGWAAAE